MYENNQNTHPTEPEKEIADAAQTVDSTATESNKMPDIDETEEASTESSKALQKEVAEKEHQINQQLEVLWASGTQQMLGNHTEPFIAPTFEQKPTQQVPSTQQPVLLESAVSEEQHTTQKANDATKQVSLTKKHEEHELIPIEDAIDEKAKKKTRKKRAPSVKKKKESS